MAKATPAEKHRPTVADWVVTAISPALIVGLVGSLVFFLAEVLYAGKYESRLLWTLFFFVVGIVLVARISIQIDSTRAAFYGLGLAVVSWIALMAFIEFPKESRMAPFAPFINLMLMAIVWWSAHKLTWDCTFIDEKRQASGQGILAAAGLEQRADTQGQARDRDLRRKETELTPDPNLSLYERWKRYREWRKTRPHTPGISVVWFSLAALPIFGLGQALIPAGDSARRTFTFWLAAVYVASGLGLLLTTSFLGLRRYLRQRKLQMPQAMTGAWLGLGAALVLGFIVVAALLPRPYSETPVWALKRIGSPDRKASKNAQLRDGAGKGKGQSGNQTEAGDGQSTGPNGKPGGKGEDGKSKEGSGNKKDGDGNGQSKEEGSGRDGSKAGNEQGENGEKSNADRDANADSDGNSDRRFPDTKLGNALEKITTFLKWVVFILLGLIVLAFLFRGMLRHLGQFMPWAQRWLESLRAWWARFWGKKEDVITDLEIVASKPRARPFTSFNNPFLTGTDDRSIEELIEYSFTALEAWANDRNHPRQPNETPLEFASRLSNLFASLQGEAQKLAILVVRLAYANGALPKDARNTLEFFWDRLTTTMPTGEAALTL